MPLYEYRCDSCGELFEVMQKFADQPLTVHEACGGTVHRLLSAPAFNFKGSGWYVNDYAKGSKSGGSGGTGSSNKTDPSSKSGSPANTTSSSESGSSSSTSTSNTSSDKK